MKTISFQDRRHRAYLLCAILAISVLVYLPGLNGGFLYDDYINIVNNPLVHPESLSPLVLLQAAGSFTPGGRHLSMLSFAVNDYFLGPSPYGYKAVNLTIHLLNGLLVFFLTSLLLKAKTTAGGQQEISDWLPLLVTAAWLLNPMQLTTVLYVVQRMTGLSALFVLAGLLMYTSGRLRQQNGESGLPLIVTGLVGGTLLAWLSKENGVLLLPFTLLIEFAFFRFKGAAGKTDWNVFVLLIVVPILALILMMVLTGYFHDHLIAGYRYREFTLEQRLLTEARILWLYLFLILAPNSTRLGIWHDDIAVSDSIMSPINTLPAVAGIGLLLIAGVYLLRKEPLIGFGILWYFVAHALESTIIPLELAHEHRNYLASYGVLLALMAGITLVFNRGNKTRLAIPVAVTIIAAYTAMTYVRSDMWANPLQHALIEAKHHPTSPNAQLEAGKQLIGLSTNNDSDRLKAGMAYLETAARLDKNSFIADLSLIITSERNNLPYNPQWLDRVKRKLRQSPLGGSDISALRSLLECQQSRRCQLPGESVRELFKLAARKGNLQAVTLHAFYEANVMGQIEPARLAFEEAVHKAPREPSFRVNYASFLVAVGDYANARTQLAIASRLDTFRTYKDQIDKEYNNLPGNTPAQQ